MLSRNLHSFNEQKNLVCLTFLSVQENNKNLIKNKKSKLNGIIVKNSHYHQDDECRRDKI